MATEYFFIAPRRGKVSRTHLSADSSLVVGRVLCGKTLSPERYWFGSPAHVVDCYPVYADVCRYAVVDHHGESRQNLCWQCEAVACLAQRREDGNV